VPRVLGIDEAGRGAVLGPLVVAGIVVDEERLPFLAELGARDSKRVARPRRRALLRELVRAADGARAVVIPAADVDQENLTEIELSAAARLIVALHPDRTVLDTPVPPPAIPGFVARLGPRAGIAPQAIVAFPKADRDHPAVAAASLLAKVVRDAFVLALHRHYGDFGWGYPGEAKVRAFLVQWLAHHGRLPPICRTRWRSVPRLLSPELAFPVGPR
jgi:ribonuclease HII